MSDFSDAFLAEIRSELETQRRELVAKGREMLEEMRERGEADVGDSIDTSTDEQTSSTMLRLKDREQSLLYKIDETIRRMDDGDYGYCASCEEPIGLKRLRARPVATLCIECKEEEEKREKHSKIRPGLLE